MENKPISEIVEGGVLSHFNPNHDALGRFASSSVGAIRSFGGRIAGGSKRKTNTVPVEKIVSKKSRKQKSAEAKAEVRKKANTSRERRESLEKAIRNADVKTVYERRAELTDKQLSDFVKRVETDQALRAMVAAQTPSRAAKVKSFAKKVNDLNDIAQTGLKVYKTGAEIKSIMDKKNDAYEKAAKAQQVAEIVNDTTRIAELYANRKDYSKEAIDKAVNKYNSEQKLKTIVDEIGKTSPGEEPKEEKKKLFSLKRKKDK